MFGKFVKEKTENKIKELKALKKSIELELQHKPDDYTVGFYNGIERSIAGLEGREPEFCTVAYEAEEIKTEQPKQKRTLYGGVIK